MNSKAKEILFVATILLVGLNFLVTGMISASGFLKPLAIAILLTMMLIPLSRKLEGWGLNRGISSLLSVFVAIIAVFIVLGLFAVQIHNVSEDWPEIKQNLEPAVENFQEQIEEWTGLSPKEQLAFMENKIPFSSEGKTKDQQSMPDTSEEISGDSKEKDSDKKGLPSLSGITKGVGAIGSAMMNLFSFMGTFFLVFVYIFFFLFYRRKIKNSILVFFEENKRESASKVLGQSIRLSEKYILGRAILLLFLGVIYSIGLSSFGIDNAIFISIFAALLTLIPYIGNVIGFVLAMAMATFSGGELWMYIGVAITFTVAQFVESYILQPYVVGQKVDLNPLITILVVIIGGTVWGIMGMIISIPLFGIVKIICDNIPALQPLGYTLGDEDIGDDEPGFFDRLVSKIKKRFE